MVVLSWWSDLSRDRVARSLSCYQLILLNKKKHQKFSIIPAGGTCHQTLIKHTHPN